MTARIIASLRGVVTAGGGSIPAFASGGLHTGGLRLVGENGPELEATGPSRIYSASQTRSMLGGGDNGALISEIRALREEVSALRISANETAVATKSTDKTLKNAAYGGQPLATTAV